MNNKNWILIDRQYDWTHVLTRDGREYYVLPESATYLVLLVIQDGRGCPQVGEYVDASIGDHDGAKYRDFVRVPVKHSKLSVRSRAGTIGRGEQSTKLSTVVARSYRSNSRRVK